MSACTCTNLTKSQKKKKKRRREKDDAIYVILLLYLYHTVEAEHQKSEKEIVGTEAERAASIYLPGSLAAERRGRPSI